jgi:D-glycero-alpha-D-manno-heptose-7-phosphate kinase
MIISRTPFRVSFFGGGTDYPRWFEKHKGAVLGTTIDKYCYITCRYLPPFFEHKSRIIYSKMEHVHTIEDIDHPAVREVLRFLNIRAGIEIHHDGDLPARAGLGSSSSFTVGLLNSLYALKGIMPTKDQLAKEAIYIEQQMCRENVGCQDQVLAAHGGFNFIEFGGSNHLRVRQVTLSVERINVLQTHLMIFFTGFHRPEKNETKKILEGMGDRKEQQRTPSSEIIAYQIKGIPQKAKDYNKMYDMALFGMELLNQDRLIEFGELLHEAWMVKRTLSSKITTDVIDDIYATARRAGALGGKILGAGGGGFLLLFAEPRKQPRIREKLKKLLQIPFRFENQGSQIIFYQPYTGQVS